MWFPILDSREDEVPSKDSQFQWTTAVPTADPVQWRHGKHPSQKEGKYLSVPVKRTALTVN